MNKYSLVVFLTILFNVSLGQSSFQDVVYLKNGGIIRGIIVEQVPNKNIKIKTFDENIFIFQLDEIEKIAKEPIKLRGSRLDLKKNNLGYLGLLELGYKDGVGEFGKDRLKLNAITGYKVHSSISIGVGTGIRYYFQDEIVMVPMFSDFRFYFFDKGISPYYSLGMGYSFNVTDDFDSGGFLFNTSVGVSLNIGNKKSLNIGVGYEMQRMNYLLLDLNGSEYYAGYVNSKAISVTVGITIL